MRRAKSLNGRLYRRVLSMWVQLEVRFLTVNQVWDKRQDQLFSPRQDSHKVVGTGGMEEWLNIPQLALKGLKLHPSADTHNLLDLHPAAKHRLKRGNICERDLCVVAYRRHAPENWRQIIVNTLARLPLQRPASYSRDNNTFDLKAPVKTPKDAVQQINRHKNMKYTQ